jgi:hypothetical protein
MASIIVPGVYAEKYREFLELQPVLQTPPQNSCVQSALLYVLESVSTALTGSLPIFPSLSAEVPSRAQLYC